jgi:N-methylhydantoinase A/oxoprolinase/acetone carboxylase beta subunit
LLDRGLVALGGFTPSDAAHILGLHDQWSAEAARLGAEIWLRHDEAAARPTEPDAAALARRVVDAVIVQSGRAVVETMMAAEDGTELSARDVLARQLIDRALGEGAGRGRLLNLSVRLDRPLVAVGAPAPAYYPPVAERLGAQLLVPEHADVCNAVGAVVGGIVQSVTAVITAPSDGMFRVHLPAGNADFSHLEEAAAHAAATAAALARNSARAAGAVDIELRTQRSDAIHRDPAGGQVFIESRIEVTAFGRPRAAS